MPETRRIAVKANRSCAVVSLVLAIAFLGPIALFANSGHEIDASVDDALQRFEKEVKGAAHLIEKARGVLVLPKVVKGGLIVGAEYGEGALRIGDRTVSYYSVASASFGLTFGGEMKDLVIVFLTEDALEKFRSSKGWEAGVDGNIAVIKIGGGASVDTTKFNEPIVGFVVGVKGLLVDASLNGSKFTRIER
jgi:lipid-binding SYLF domain-containing protein